MVEKERDGRGSWPGKCPELSRKGITRIGGRKGGVAEWFEVMARPDRVGQGDGIIMEGCMTLS